MKDDNSVIVESPDVLGGVPVFRGTRVPVSTLFDYIIKGHSLDDFFDDFPAVTREQATKALAECKDKFLERPP